MSLGIKSRLARLANPQHDYANPTRRGSVIAPHRRVRAGVPSQRNNVRIASPPSSPAATRPNLPLTHHRRHIWQPWV